MTAPAHRRGERGALASSTAALAAALVVGLAAIYFVVSGGDGSSKSSAEPTPTAITTPSPSESPSTAPTTTAAPSPSETESAETLRRTDFSVTVFNNSDVTGLATSTAERLERLGWVVTGADNWTGDIPESTVYYPKGLRAAAELLAQDLGIERLRPRESGMALDRLTLILTGELD
jgi:hypothetical protein